LISDKGEAMDTLKFAVGDADELNKAVIKSILQSKGYSIACDERDGPSLLRKVRSILPDFVIISCNIPGMKGSEIARIVEGDRIAPVILIADSPQDMLAREMGSDNFAYILKPVSEIQLIGTIEFVYSYFKRLVNLEHEVSELKEMLETRKLVEKAKGILMDKFNMKEKDAFKFIQKKSMDECAPITDIARKIIDYVKDKKNG
jgi:response regulator NasT